MLVPYVPSQRARTFPTVPMLSIGEFLASGGRLNSMRRSNYGQSHTSSTDEEKASLLARDEETKALLIATNRSLRMTQCSSVIAIIGIFAVGIVFVMVGISSVSTLNRMREAIEPHAASIVNATLGTFGDMSGSLSDVHDMTTVANAMAQKALKEGGAADVAINSSTAMVLQLQEFMKHPSIKISLGS